MNKKKVFTMFAAIALLLFVGVLFINGECDDFAFHTARLINIAKEFKAKGIGAIPIRIYSFQNNGYGYGTPLFYGDVFIYPFALLHTFGVNEIFATKILYFAAYLMNFIIPYFACKKVIGEEKSALFALFYSVAPYTIVNLIHRGALGELIASAFIPLILAIFYKILIKEERSKINIVSLAVSLALMLNAHMILTFLTVLMIAFCFIVHTIKKKDLVYFKKTFIAFAVAALIFFALEISFILPMLEQIFTYEFRALYGSGFVASRYTLDLPRVLSAVYDYMVGIVYGVEISVEAGGFYYPILILLAILFADYYRNKKKGQNSKYIPFMMVLLFLTVLIMWDVPWKIFEGIISFIQFPWRLSLFAYLFAAFVLMDMFFNEEFDSFFRKISLGIYQGVSAVYILAFFMFAIPAQIEGKYPYSHDTINSISMQDYISVYSTHLTDESLNNELVGYDGEYEVVRDNGTTVIHFNNYNSTIERTFELPVIPYKGYTVIANNDKMMEYKIGPYAQMEVTIDSGYEVNDILIKYDGTLIQKVTFVISFLAWNMTIGTMGYLLLKKNHKQKQ